MGGLRYVVGDPDVAAVADGHLDRRFAGRHLCRAGRLMAIHARKRTGRGQVVDSAIYEAVLAMMESLVTEYDQVGMSANAPARSCPMSRPAMSTRPKMAR